MKHRIYPYWKRKGGIMKYILKLELDKPEFRSDYRRTVISFFKKSISNYMDGLFYDKIYNSGTKMKSFVWSIRFSNPKFLKDKIELETNEIMMTLKFADAETALIYFSSLLEMKKVRFPVGNGNFMTLRKIEMIREPLITQGIATFKVLSPICLKSHNGDNNNSCYIDIEKPEFALELQRKLIEDMPNRKDDIEKLMYNFDGMKKVIVPAYGIEMPTTIGTFTVKGENDILNHMLTNGVGSKRNSGFGLIEFVC